MTPHQRSPWRITDALRWCAPGVAALLLLAARPPGAGEAAAGTASAALRDALAAPTDTGQVPRLDVRGLARIYPASRPRWVDDSGPLPRAHRLRAALERSEAEGLPPDRYGLAGIAARWEAPAPTERACLDPLLTGAFDRYGHDLATGLLTPREADPTWHLPAAAGFDPVTALHEAPADADPGNQLEALAPTYGLYARLRAALAHYRRLAAEGGWDTTPPGPAVGPGDEGERVAAIRERLRREGDLDAGRVALDRSQDAASTDAVRRFQRRHGLLADGVVGPRTLAALNVPVAHRIAQLRRAMERLRWLPRDRGSHYVLVNTAGFELSMVERDRIVLGMRVIVGAPDQPTPSFTATRRSLTINPYWNVPRRIARDTLVPRERRHPGHLAARGFRVLDPRTGQWGEPDATSLAGAVPQLRQEPGPGNLMGRLSFGFPNPFDVFLHDSPDRALFEREVRACSEGCVRIEQAMTLALPTLRRAPEWTEARIQEEIDALRHRVLLLPEPIPVYVVYLPSWVDEAGVAHFRPDHYGRERVLARHFPP